MTTRPRFMHPRSIGPRLIGLNGFIGPLYDESLCNDWSPLYFMFFEGTNQTCLIFFY
jgi:hypothetical protein